MNWQETHRERKELYQDVIIGEVWYLQTFPPSELTAQVVTYRLLVNLSNRNWDFSYNKFPYELWELERMNGYKILFKHYAGSVIKLLDYFCRHRYVLWVQALLEFCFERELTLTQDYILYVAKSFPTKFVHYVPFLSTARGGYEQKEFFSSLLKIVVKNRSCVCWQQLLPYLDTEEMLYALCKYHSDQLKYCRNKDRYWDSSKLTSFSVMVELAFCKESIFTDRVLQVMPDLWLAIQDAGFPHSRIIILGKRSRGENCRANSYSLLTNPSMVGLIFENEGQRIGNYHIGLSLTPFLLFYLAHGFPEELPKEMFEDYRGHLEETFRCSNACLYQARFLLADFAWKNYYRYLYCFDVLPMELRVHIGSLCW